MHAIGSTTEDRMHPTAELTGISKAFAGVQALKGVSFDLRAGEVHALVGENGAGKSTLIKVITGAHRPDEGTLEVEGQSGRATSTRSRARDLGIAAIYQQPALFPDLTVAENIAIGLEPGGAWRRVRWGERRDAGAAAARTDRRGDRPGDRGPRAVDARAAARRDRPGARGRRADPDHGRADRLAQRHRRSSGSSGSSAS